MNITEFAEKHGVKVNAVSNYLARHPELKEHTRKNGKATELDDELCEILDKVYPLPKPVEVINGVDPEEHRVLLEKLTMLQDRFIDLQKASMEREKYIAQAETQKALLEANKATLDETVKEKEARIEEQAGRIREQEVQLEDLRKEVERLRGRKLMDRIFNR